MTKDLKDRIAKEWAMLDPVDPLRKLLSDVMDVLSQPAPPPPECKTEAEQTAYAFGWWKALEAQPRNFCPRCGKRTADLTVIHTCTPPRGLEMT